MKRAILASIAAFLPAFAQAQSINPFPGVYVGAGGGLEWALGNNPNASTSTGWAVGGKVGYDFVGPRVDITEKVIKALNAQGAK